MSELAKYNPLKTIWLPGPEIIDPAGVIVVVGPNSSGKTLFLRDIENYLLTGNADFVVCEGIAANKPVDFQAFIEDLISTNYLQRAPAQNMFGGQVEESFRTYVPLMRHTEPNVSPKLMGGMGGSGPSVPGALNPQAAFFSQSSRQTFQMSALKTSYDDFLMDRNGDNSGWFGRIGLTLAALLSLDQRRFVCNKVPSFDYKQNPPDLPLQGLHINGDAKRKLAEETGNVFGNACWLDISEQGVYQLRVSGTRKRPPIEEANSPLDARKYLAIEQEGDGYRSYVGICLSLLLANRPVSLIDEPELCLHPPQAHHIGRFIGQYAPQDHVTIVATHSSHVLRGILETGKRATVIRLTRQKNRFQARSIAEKQLVDNLRNPRTRAESILDGVFSKAVVLVEGDGDREEYQAASEAIDDYPSREVHFVPVGGTGFAAALRFYQSLKIPSAIVADLDFVCDVDKVEVLTKLLSADPESLIRALREVSQQIKSLPGPISETEVKERLQRLSEEELDWKNADDNRLRKILSELEKQLRRIQRIKDGGVAAYADHPQIQSALRDIINRFALIGLFFVPVGELEDWVSHLMKSVPKSTSSKTERAAVAANLIREADNKTGDIWDFVEGVLDFLKSPDE